MNQYELGLVLRSTLTEEEVTSVTESIRSRIEDLGGKTTGVNLWGKRRLAYPIRKQNEGIYLFIQFVLSPQSVKELVRTVQFADSVIRYILVKEKKKATKEVKNQQEAPSVEDQGETELEESEVSSPGENDGQASSSE